MPANPRFRVFESGFQRPYTTTAGAPDPNAYGTTAQMYEQCLRDNMISPGDVEGKRDCMREAATNPTGWFL